MVLNMTYWQTGGINRLRGVVARDLVNGGTID